MIHLKNINKSYWIGKEEVPILHNINLSIEEGEYVSIMGPSGSGKSTIMNILGCLDTPTSGEYILDGNSVLSRKENELSKIRNEYIGFVFQNFNLLPRLTALDNVQLPLVYAKVNKKERKELAIDALAKVGLKDRINFKPTQLSGGQKQRVAIARALINKPKFILADEPTGALDTASSEQVMNLFTELNKEGVTIVLITHEEEIAQYAKRSIFLRDGAIIKDERRELHAR
ncbi:ABC transporter ATP-binding protein [Pseudobacillus badius]|uniref:ABC transporter ATP-binding protein n=1 Tax=Bacillus badius TaxID=1455 RepID=UPI0007B079B3|nr:ABC transporter ATP-binding protein [Bacillus badius]KZO01224.1 macrolide ABC transporter ATP-binding protein [Bacillus badius]OCS89402.1 macrolide ABC transporter ATP-binding protein [Bacillus badius]OVE51219.1 macrolide ABC transporter ATP-binding protein [Bacillus badius]TDW02207.1 putative ABC transport system ATP-binding protein [Bacillus badius]